MGKTRKLKVGSLYRSNINWVCAYDKRGMLVSIGEGEIAMYLGFQFGWSATGKVRDGYSFLFEDRVVCWSLPPDENDPAEWWNDVGVE